MSDYDNIPVEMQQLEQWVGYRSLSRKNGKIDKVPIHSITKSFAKTDDPNTWTTFATAVHNISPSDGLGFVVCASNRLLFLDLDDCMVDGKPNMFARDLVKNMKSYYQRSTGTCGIHIFVKVRDGVDLNKFSYKGTTLEVYSNLRYAAMTGYVGKGKVNPLITMTEEQENYLLSKIEEAKITDGKLKNLQNTESKIKKLVSSVEGTDTKNNVFTKYNILMIQDALNQITTVSEDQWFNQVTRSIASSAADHPEFEKPLFRIWDNWCQTQDGYDKDENLKRWDRAVATTSRVTLGTLIHLAREQNPDWSIKKSYNYEEKIGDQIVLTTYTSPNDAYQKVLAGITGIASDDGLPVRSAFEMMTTVTKSSVDNFAITDFLPCGTTFLSADPKSGKSCAMTQLTTCFVTGRKFMDKYDIAKKGNVLIISNEESTQAIIERIIFQNNGATFEEMKNIYIRGNETELFVMDELGLARIENEYVKPFNIKYVFIDIWDNVRPGAAKGVNAYTNENAQAKYLRNYASASDVSFIILHHLNKSTVNTGFSRISGTQASRGAWDTNIIIETVDDGKKIFAVSSETRKMGCNKINGEKILIQHSAKMNWKYAGNFNKEGKSIINAQILQIIKQSKDCECNVEEILGGISDVFAKEMKRHNIMYYLMLMIDAGILRKVTNKRGMYGLADGTYDPNNIAIADTVPVTSLDVTDDF